MKIIVTVFSMLLAATWAWSQPGKIPSAYNIDRVKVGDAAPNFTLEDASRRKITLADFRRKKNVVLVFYRGFW